MRRQFGRGYGSRPVRRADSHYHRVLAKEITMNATCAFASRGGCSGDLEADHIVPWSQGGESTRENLRPLCQHHNRERGVQTREENRKRRN